MISNFYYDLEDVPIDKIIVGKFRIREAVDKEHVDRIANDLQKTNVQLDPIELWKNDDSLELMDGEHRYLGHKKAGKNTIKAKIWIGLSEKDAWLFVSKKIAMKKITKPIEDAKLILRLLDNYGYTQKQIAEELGRPESWISNRLVLVLDCEESVRKYVQQEKLSFSKAQIIAKLDKKIQKKFVEKAIKNKWNLEQVKQQYELIINPSQENAKAITDIPIIKDEVKEVVVENKERFEILKRSLTFVVIKDNFFDKTCEIKINDLDKKDFFCVTHNGLFCNTIMQYLKTIDKKDWEAIPLSEDEVTSTEMAKKYLESSSKEENITEETTEESTNEEKAGVEIEKVEDSVIIRTASDSVPDVEEVVEPDIEKVEETKEILNIPTNKIVDNRSSSIFDIENSLSNVDITLSISKEQYEQLQAYCNNNKVELNSLLINCINKILKNK